VYSGPQSIEQLSAHLDEQRLQASEIMHMMATYVCQAFPAYKPEDVYAMNYDVFMLRVAQAENKLLRTGGVAQPLSFITPDGQTTAPVQQPERPKVDTRNLKEEFKKQTQKQTKQTVIKSQDIKEHEMVYVGHEVEDKVLLEHQMVKETATIYQDYLQQSKDGKISIKTPEQRKAEYLANIEKIKKQQALRQAQQKELQEKALKEKELKESKKPKKTSDKRRR
jgi:hypothetical protein